MEKNQEVDGDERRNEELTKKNKGRRGRGSGRGLGGRVLLFETAAAGCVGDAQTRRDG